jgi:hypothetical protein
VVVTSLQAGDDASCALAVSWCEAKGDPVPAPPAPVSAPLDGVARVLPGRSRNCPDCNAELRDLGNDRVCTRCSWDSTAQA